MFLLVNKLAAAFFCIIYLNGAYSQNLEGNAGHSFRIQIVPASTIGSSVSQAKPLTYGDVGITFLGTGLINEAIKTLNNQDKAKSPLPLKDEAQGEKLAAIVIKSNTQIYLAEQIAKELSRCDFTPTLLQVAPPEQKNAKELLSISKGSVTSIRDSDYLLEIEKLGFSVSMEYVKANMHNGSVDHLGSYASAELIKLPSQKSIKKYSAAGFQEISNFKDLSIEDSEQLRVTLEAMMNKSAKNISYQICKDKASGLLN